MLSTSDLSDGQIQEIKTWVSEGAQMADVQKRLKDDFDLNATYMDTRFLALDLGLEFFKEDEEEEEEELESPPVEEPEDTASQAGLEVLPTPEGAPSVSVGLDQVAYPGSMVSGSVTFSDGEKGKWMIDAEGRPSIDPDTTDYRPSQEDLVDFQAKLQKIFENQM